jgi:hypothetical protein
LTFLLLSCGSQRAPNPFRNRLIASFGLRRDPSQVEGLNVKLLEALPPASKIAPTVVKIFIGKRELKEAAQHAKLLRQPPRGP